MPSNRLPTGRPAARLRFRRGLAWLLLGLCLNTLAVTLPQEQVLTLNDGTELPLGIYPAEGSRLLLWLPSEFGPSPRQGTLAEALAARDIEVWLPDLHAGWFLAPGRYSLNTIPPQAVAELIAQAAATGKQVFLLASGRTAALALRALRHLQLAGRSGANIAGLISIGPRLFLRTPQGGEAADFLPITTASNVPIHILQPRNAGGFWRLGRVIRMLEQGGAPVSWQVIDGVRDAFHVRDDTVPAEEAASARLPDMLATAMQLLAPSGGLPTKAAPMAGEDLAPRAAEAHELLRRYEPPHPAPKLVLARLDGRPLDLRSLRGQVVLVNFWATWCPPCIEEIPALERLYRARRDQGLTILAVAVGDPPERVRDFLASHPVRFPVLLDEQGEALKRWGVHAFPTTFVLDRAGRIRHGGFGAFAWDGPDIAPYLEPLLQDALRPALPDRPHSP
ncbi:TlpA disulfide reductase family protein [endosymbiont of unidentified scaly snail isolate Monju]|uniref:TlpA disulfide reductase family protein n=1 Tax=endosymbiont of unidentified scaly snail isolate Monju TaxID=1248727 RepID=UPI0003892A1A|nr:TlpA disulfide reductase family protein [endosymbiont of unidentified scaly snail isolate Monju]BAN69864.1 thioredoxin family protein [endosymbiont of unidentified scaly snail isolate Monju]